MRVVGNIQMKVNKIIQETPFVKRFELFPVDGKPLPAFTGGSHLTTYMPAGDKIFEREYSLISNPRDRNKYTISIRRDEASRGGSAFWHDQVKVDSRLEVSFPKNNFLSAFELSIMLLCSWNRHNPISGNDGRHGRRRANLRTPLCSTHSGVMCFL